MVRAEQAKRKAERERIERLANAEQIRAECQTLMGFIRHAWPVLEPVTQFKAGWTIEAMADHLEAVTSGDIQNLLMNVPPGTMKSLMTSVFHGAWEWTFAPSTTIFSASHASTLAERDARKMRTLVGSQWYQDLWGHVVKPSSKWGDRYMENDRLGWRRPVAFEHMTGFRALLPTASKTGGRCSPSPT